MTMSIVLIGYRGSGKTTLGRLLAGELGHSFVDLDELITAAAGKSIKEIFATEGEAGFRQRESQALLEVIKRENHVISLGGGAVLAEHNRRVIQESGHIVVYLRASADELHRRINADPSTAAQRPSLTRLGGSVQEVRSLLEQREPIYQQVKTMELDVESNDLPALLGQLVEQLTRDTDLRPVRGAS
jgi:shikimate kinase